MVARNKYNISHLIECYYTVYPAVKSRRGKELIVIIYIAGPITGIYDYKRQFRKRERMLKTMGHVVLNPSFLPSGLEDYMPTCKAMIDQSDAIYFMDGWKGSIGAKEEYEYAKQLGKKIIYESDIKDHQNPKDTLTEAEYWHREAIKATAELGEIKMKLYAAISKAGVKNGKQMCML